MKGICINAIMHVTNITIKVQYIHTDPNHSDLCKVETKFEAANAADPPRVVPNATTNCKTTCHKASSGTK